MRHSAEVGLNIQSKCRVYRVSIFKGWTETYVTWSPQGTYLATFHKQGIALWGGDEFSRIGKFGHQGVQMIDFSPCERFEKFKLF